VIGATENVPGESTDVKRTEGVIEYALDYGLPGKPGYT
jgi:hypothetical protein